MLTRFRGMSFCLLLSAFASGCSTSDKPELVEVGGTLTKNGKPFADALVEFYPEANAGASYGTTDEQGKFKLSYTTGEPGAAIGQHTVKVIGGRTVGTPEPVVPAPAPTVDGSEETFSVVADPSKTPKGNGGPPPAVVLTAEVLPDVPNSITLTMP
jgi:hypothetical protein